MTRNLTISLKMSYYSNLTADPMITGCTTDRENLCGEWESHKRILTCSSILKRHRTRYMTKSMRFLTEEKMWLHDSDLPKQILLEH